MDADSPIQLPCVCGSLRRAVRAVTRVYDEELRASGLKSGQLSLLMALARAGPTSQGTIGQLLVLDHSTLSRTLRPLLHAGLVRVRAGDDKRERIVEMTTKGRARLERALPAWKRAQARLLKALGADQAQALGAVTQAVTRAALRA